MNDLTTFEGSAPSSTAPAGLHSLWKEWSWCFRWSCDGERETGGGICRLDGAVTSAWKNVCMHVCLCGIRGQTERALTLLILLKTKGNGPSWTQQKKHFFTKSHHPFDPFVANRLQTRFRSIFIPKDNMPDCEDEDQNMARCFQLRLCRRIAAVHTFTV